MNNPINPAAPLSASNQAKLDKEKLEKIEVKQKEPDRSKSGFENPCVFGVQNPNFDQTKSL